MPGWAVEQALSGGKERGFGKKGSVEAGQGLWDSLCLCLPLCVCVCHVLGARAVLAGLGGAGGGEWMGSSVLGRGG